MVSADALSMVAPPPPDPRLDREMLDMTNAFRAENGLPPMRWHKGLAEVAGKHAALVAEGRAPFTHAGAPERFARCGTRCINVAENLARSDGFSRENLPGAALAGWCGSEGHKRNLLGPFDACGIGWAASDAGTIFVTQLLALVDEPNDWQGRLKEAAVKAVSSSPMICAVVGLALTGGPLMTVTGGLAGAALERRFGLRIASAPRALRDVASRRFNPPVCSCCGKPSDTGELLASSWGGREGEGGGASDDQWMMVHGGASGGGTLLCRSCHPSAADADVWYYVG